ncbi:MAG: alpha/beta hydrolase [Bradyrhizobium sp.]|nr:alpha/beta hydrolase [Bradyrhizobium sp.]
MAKPEIRPHESVTFWSEGIECAADLYLQDTPGPHPGLVLGHGHNQTKDGLTNEGNYLRAAGYNVMIIDYRNLGRSGGEDRGQIFPRRQVEDLRHAITYFSRRDDVDADRIGIYGVSFAGGIALQVAAFDIRVKACVSQSPIVNGRRWMRDLRSAYDYNQLLLDLQRSFEDSYGPSGENEWKKVRHNSPSAVAVPAAVLATKPAFDPENPNSCAFPNECQPTFDTNISFESMLHTLDWNPTDAIDMIAPRPLLIVGNAGGPYDWVHPPEPIQEAFARAGEPKELIFLPYDAYGLYQEPGRGEAMAAAIAFYDKHLK